MATRKLYFTNTISAKQVRKIDIEALKSSSKFCNGLCQETKPLSEFFTDFEKFLHCKKCHSYLILAKKMVKYKQITIQQFVENPDIVHGKLPIYPEGSKICSTCNIEKSLENFEMNRKICKPCRHSASVQRTAESVKTNIVEIEKLKDNIEGLKKYLLYLPADVLAQITKILKVGRKSTDHKNSMITNIINHFTRLQNPKICLGGCGNTLSETHSYCDACKKTPKKISIAEDIGKFENNISEFLQTFQGLKPEEEINYNVPKLIIISRTLGLHVNTAKRSTKRDLIDRINEKIKKDKERQEEKEMEEEKILEEQEQKTVSPLILNDIVICSRYDGYINVTQLCQAGKKGEIKNWNQTKKSKDFMESLSRSVGIPTDRLMQTVSNGLNELRGTWAHPQVAINIAQWISSDFDVQVSQWVFQLMTTGKVEIGKEKTSKQLLELQQELVAERQARKKIEDTHNKLLKKREYHKFKKGPAFYIISDNDSKSLKCKPGIDREDVNVRLQHHRSTTPSIKVEYLIYTENCGLIETSILKRYESNRDFANHEWVFDVSVDEVITSVKTLLNFLCIEYTEDKELDEYNAQVENPCE